MAGRINRNVRRISTVAILSNGNGPASEDQTSFAGQAFSRR
jgi:hypothetical protein